MNNLVAFFRDPIFGVAVLVAIVALIVLSTYFWNLAAKKRQHDSLGNFMKIFEGMRTDDVAKETLQKLGSSLPALEFLAETYRKMGDYERSMNLYHAILECDLSSQERLAILQSLGEIYYLTGFLERAKKVLLEVLKNHPRNKKALGILMRTLESLALYDEALDALGCLKQLGLDSDIVMLNMAYFAIQKELHKDNPDPKLLLQYLHENHELFPFVMRCLKTLDKALFWQTYTEFAAHGEGILDLLWNEEIPPNLVSDSILHAIDCAKNGGESCVLFELEALRCLHEHGNQKGDLCFSYQCRICAQTYPIRIDRCTHCGALLTQQLRFAIKPLQSFEYENCPALL
ncbi:MAG: hypothetical protein K2O85_01190 [Helicobacter sp.]|nr:hypothetical protein [Helicobacter sp.]